MSHTYSGIRWHYITIINCLFIDLIASDTEMNEQQQQQQIGSDMPEEAEYIDWLPPINQSGDGISKLNDEFGY